MSEVFEGYEHSKGTNASTASSLPEFLANVTRTQPLIQSRILDNIAAQKQKRISEIKAGLDDADILIRKMDLEARSLQPSTKAILLVKLREYKADLNNLKKEFKRLTSPNVDQPAREKLLESPTADAHLASAEQRERMAMSIERINQSSDRITESRRTMLETEELGVSILQDLHQQRETLLHSHKKLHGVDDTIDKSQKVLTTMSRRITKNKFMVGSVIGALAFAIIVVPLLPFLLV